MILLIIFHQSYPFMKGLVSFNNVIYDNMGACVAIEKHFGKKAFLDMIKGLLFKIQTSSVLSYKIKEPFN